MIRWLIWDLLIAKLSTKTPHHMHPSNTASIPRNRANPYFDKS